MGSRNSPSTGSAKASVDKGSNTEYRIAVSAAPPRFVTNKPVTLSTKLFST